jgi:hypothetical protein
MVAVSAAEFVERFEQAWAGDGVEPLAELWSEDIELHQPLLGSLHGREECRRAFSKVFVLSPDLRTEVHDWAGDLDSLYVAFTFHATFGGAKLQWPAVDRFRISGDGLILRRDSYWDLAQVMLMMVGRPRGWTRMFRAGLIPRRPHPPRWPAAQPASSKPASTSYTSRPIASRS